MKFFLFVICHLAFVIIPNVEAAFESKQLFPRAAAMAGAFTGISNDASAPFFNPAGLNISNAKYLSFSQSSLYSEGDLKYTDFGFSYPTVKMGSFAFNMTSFGASFYKEKEFVFTHSFLLGKGGYFGYNIRKLVLDIGGTGSDSVYAMDFGAMGLVSQQISLGFSVKGLNRPQIAGEDLYREISYGFAYRPFRGMVADIDWCVPSDREENILKAGVEFTVTPVLSVRFGVEPSPQKAAFGFGIMLGHFDLDYAFQTHEMLDNQHLFSLSVRWGEKRELAAPTVYQKSAVKKTAPVAEKPSAEISRIDINEADVSALTSLPGIGKVTATRIVEYRNTHGLFSSPEDLLNVPRFTKTQFEKIKDYITVGKPAEEGKPQFAPPIEKKPSEEKEELSEEEKENLKKDYYYQGMHFYQAGEYKKAIEFFEKILELDPTHPQSIRLIEKCKQEMEK